MASEKPCWLSITRSLRVLSFCTVLLIWSFFATAQPLSLDFTQRTIPVSREAFLDEIQRGALLYFIEQRNPRTGLIRDWAFNARDKRGISTAPATIAGTGFALTAYGVGVERGWLQRSEVLPAVRKMLLFLRDEAPHERGFFYHFLDYEEGTRANQSEVSPIDTAIAVAGVIFIAEYLNDPEIKELAREIYERIDWPWMLNGGMTFAHGWSPERGFFMDRWSTYSEGMLLYLLALGSPTHPIPAESWRKIVRKIGRYKSYHLIQSPSLFTHQYPHIWFDLRNKNDGFADYFENSRRAVLAQRDFAIDQSARYTTYGPNSWGFTAAEAFGGYKIYGAPPGLAHHDGTIVPTGCGASVPFAPEESIACLEHLRDAYGKRLWGRYGFSDSVNAQIEWYSDKVFAINQGPILLMIENYRSELIWKVMNQLPLVKRAFEKAGFRKGTLELPWHDPPEMRAVLVSSPLQIDGNLEDWPVSREQIRLDEAALEYGAVDGPHDLSGEAAFAWDHEFFYFYVRVWDDDLVLRSLNAQIYRDDLIEIYVDPVSDGFFWKNERDFQIGFRVDPNGGTARTWSWFQKGSDPSRTGQVQAAGRLIEDGYLMEGAIRWSFLGIDPHTTKELKLGFALHDVDRDKSEGKFHWFFRAEGGANRFELGTVKLSR